MGDHRPMLQVGRYTMTSDISLSVSQPIVFNMAAILWGDDPAPGSIILVAACPYLLLDFDTLVPYNPTT